ncbi:hypothetical protein ACN4EK_00460 [Pantanalinema rosaneae CENA516]|uniref:hypothetical protein n=1 Tax=Pantanalinema rosaneae TaxID=1620701 RepID=UPI003D6DD46D
MLRISEIDLLDGVKTLSNETAELISGGHGSGLLTALGSGGDNGIIVALGNGACDTPSQCGQTSSVLGSAIGGGSTVTAPAAQMR